MNKCKECNKKIHIWTFLYGQGRCRSCSKHGNRSSFFKDGRTFKKYYCKICKKNPIFRNTALYGSGKCKKCGMDKLKKKYYCKDCGKELSNCSANRCMFCAHKGRLSSNFGKPAHHGKGAYYKRIFMRSSYEIKFAFFLDCNNIKYKYEPERFYFKDCTYCPDFYIPEWNLYIEIKGWWRFQDKKRFNLFKKCYSTKNIKVLMKPELEELGVLT